MKNLITDEMIIKFNQMMIDTGSIFRLRFDTRVFGSVDIIIREDKYVDEDYRGQVYPNKQFKQLLSDYFEQQGIYDLSYNNTGTTFWKFG